MNIRDFREKHIFSSQRAGIELANYNNSTGKKYNITPLIQYLSIIAFI